MVKSETQVYKFGEFQINAVKRLLLHENTPLQLPSRAFDVLLVLVEHNQCVIDKDELMRLVWGERIVEENNLTRHISTLRKVLGESPNDHRYIVTVPGRGYSFVVHVERGEIESEPVGFEGASASRMRWFWAAATVVILACSLAGFNLVNTRLTSAAVNSYRDWDFVRLTHSGASYNPDITRDGKYVAYVSEESGQESVWILQLATSRRQQIVAPQKFDYRDLVFTPDGSRLYFSRTEGPSPLRSLYRIPVIGGIATKLRDDLDSPVVISPDGAHLAFGRRNSESVSEFVVANADGGQERVLAERGLLDFPAWSPDGKVIAFSLGHAGSGGPNMSIHEIRLADGAKKEISPRNWNFVGNKTWLPDGSGLIVIGRGENSRVNQLWLVGYPSGDARPLSDNLYGYKQPRVTADISSLVTEQITAVSEIWSSPLADVASARKVGVWGMFGLHALRDGRIAYTSMQPGEDVKIWMMNGDGTEKKQITTDGGIDQEVAGSPDGRYIVFTSNRSGNHEIWRMNLDGTDLSQLTKTTGAHMPSISPDGRWLIYLSTGDDYLYRIPVDGGAPFRVAGEAVGVSAVSPDGRLIAYIALGKNTWAIAVNSFDDGSAVRRFEIRSNFLNNNSLKWTPDGKALLYSASTDGIGNVWMQPLDGSTPRQVTNFKADGIFRFDVSPDGKNLICSRGAWKSDILLIKNLR